MTETTTLPDVWQCADERFTTLPGIEKWIHFMRETMEEDDYLGLEYVEASYFFPSPLGTAELLRKAAERIESLTFR